MLLRFRPIRAALACLLCPWWMFSGCQTAAEPPAPYGALPSPQQWDWHGLEYYAFVHFNMNTFTNVEWGEGRESPAEFNPSALDCRQWARICRDAGMKGIILTAKHHDGFCLWPSAHSAHTVAQSPWREGKGDVLRELSDACREYGLKFGVYLSPWDRNHPAYGSDAYNEVFKNTLREVLTGYGEVFEVWFDGANGEGPNGKKQVYDFPGFIQVVRETQPNAVIFSDAGPDVRWVGNERGFAEPENWCTLNRDDYFPGTPRYRELTRGNKGGTHWLPAEADVSIRPGWYYHPEQDDSVKSLARLWAIWHGSVGRNANLLLNLPVDRRGLVHPNDSARLMELKALLDQTYGQDLLQGARVQASHGRGGAYAADRTLDSDRRTCWAAPEGQTQAVLEYQLPESRTFSRVRLEEAIEFGQRVDSFTVEVWQEERWVQAAHGSTIGARRIVTFPPMLSSGLRVRIHSALASPALAGVSAFRSPEGWE
jgi:alpha-L-fucosidase